MSTHVVATAGHVDHGKSTLVRALTGQEPDRWAEEKRRGLTIDLGYAWTTLPSGADLAFVDVPGHQRFIANMLAGLGPAPGVLFVVAADEGWAPQSTEHLAAAHALGLQHALIAVTRSDLADPEHALAEARARLADTTLGACEAVAVSGRTGAGLPELVAALDRLVAAIPAPDPAARVRLWVDRSFTIRGSGTVVTGTLSAGTVAVGDELDLHGRTVGVRAVQSMDAPVDRIVAPARVALNLRGVAAADVRRGDVLVTPRSWHWTRQVDVRLDHPGDVPAELVLHVGSAAVPVRLRPLGAGTARLSLPRALPLQAGDRAVLRDPGRQAVAAGALVLDADPPALARRGAARARGAVLSAATGVLDPTAEVARRGAMRRERLQLLGWRGGELATLRAVGDWLVDEQAWDGWVRAARAAVADWAGRDPLDPAMPRAALRHALDLPGDPDHHATDDLFDALVAATGLPSIDGRVGTRARADLGPAERSVQQVEARLREHPFRPPDSGELAALGLGRRELAAAEQAGRLVRVGPDVVLLPTAATAALERLRTLEQPFTTSQARVVLDTTRRVAVPLLEHLDGLGVTVRVDQTTRRVR